MPSLDLSAGRQLAVAVWVSLLASIFALILSGFAFVVSLDEDDWKPTVEQRLACLELPGPNDCGLDNR
jgi:hypothetical protein